MIYLDECQAGADPSDIGFPHVLLCMAVVLQTKTWLYGFHFDDPPRANEEAGALLNFIQRKGGPGANGVMLYGCCHHRIRNDNRNPPAPNAHAAWRAEMQQIAATLGYHGRVSGFDTAIIAPEDGTYIEFHREPNTNRCRIYYKRHEKMVHDNVTLSSQNCASVDTGNINTWDPATSQKGGSWKSNVSLTKTGYLRPGATKFHELDYFLRQTTFWVP